MESLGDRANKKIIDEEKYRIKISKRVCQVINWRQANGHLKDAVCREVLRRMMVD
jgi:hypothetical protein